MQILFKEINIYSREGYQLTGAEGKNYFLQAYSKMINKFFYITHNIIISFATEIIQTMCPLMILKKRLTGQNSIQFITTRAAAIYTSYILKLQFDEKKTPKTTQKIFTTPLVRLTWQNDSKTTFPQYRFFSACLHLLFHSNLSQNQNLLKMTQVEQKLKISKENGNMTKKYRNSLCIQQPESFHVIQLMNEQWKIDDLETVYSEEGEYSTFQSSLNLSQRNFDVNQSVLSLKSC